MTGRALAIACVALASAVVAAQTRPTVTSGIAVYQDAEYAGTSRTFTLDVPNLDSSGLNDRISSIIVAPGETWELCVDSSYRGLCTTITEREPNLQESGWNDRISSMRRLRGRGSVNQGGRSIGGPALELFAGTNYSGQRKLITAAVGNFREIDFNDRAASVRVRGGVWEVCVSADFDDCRVLDEDVPNLTTLGLARVISSARPRLFGRRGGFGRQ
jgi:hypothetical protein